MKRNASHGPFYLALLGVPIIQMEGSDFTDRVLRKKALGILAYLAVESSRIHLRKDLAQLFWPDLPERSADHSLRQTLYSIRKLFGTTGPSFCDPLMVDRHMVQFNNDGVWLTDISYFGPSSEDCLSEHLPEGCLRCQKRLSEGIGLIRGPFLEGYDLPDCDDFRDWKTGTQERLQVQALNAVNIISGIREREGWISEAIRLVTQYLVIDPLDETQHRRLMELHLKNGNRRAAELQYETCRSLLWRDLGVEPEKRTRELIAKARCSLEINPVISSSLPFHVSTDSLPERQPVTVMFFECLVGEEPELDSFGPELCLSDAMERVRSLGGVPILSHGNAFLAYFGVDGQHDGAARRAARLALELPRICQSEGKTVCRGGLHSGMAYIIPDHPTPADPTGMVSRPAISLCMQANPGVFLLSEATASLLRGQFLLDPAGQFRITGGTLSAFSLVDHHGLGDSPIEDPHPQFGREQEVGKFREILKRNTGGTLFVTGEPGIGKSRLVRSFVRQAWRSPEETFPSVRCLPHYAENPFFPLTQFLRREAGVMDGLEEGMAYTRLLLYVRRLGIRNSEQAVSLLGPLLSLSPHPDFPVENNSESKSKQVIEEVLCAALLHRMTLSSLIVVEDIHWADDSTQGVLRKFLSGGASGRKELVILTSRSGETPSWMTGISGLMLMDLKPLSEKESRELVLSLAPEGRLSKEIVLRVVQNADGIPLFLEELTWSLLDQIPVNPSQMDRRRIRIPGTLSEVLFERLKRLSPEVRSLLQKAAVIGRAVPMDLFRCIAGLPIPLLESHLEDACRSGLIRRSILQPEDSFEFRHVLIQEAAYQSIIRSEQKKLHRQVALILSERFPKRADSLPGIVGRHWMEADEFGRAIEWSEKAARDCLSGAYYIEAEQHARGALAQFDRLEPTNRDRRLEVRLLVLLGNILVERFGYGIKEARSVFQQASGICDGVDSLTGEIVPVLFGLWHSSLGGDDLGKSRSLAEALGRISGSSGSVTNRAVALYAEGCVAFYEGSFIRSLDSLNTCRDSYMRARLGGDQWTGEISFEEILSMTLSYRPLVLWFLGRYSSARRELELVLDQARVAEGRQKKGLLLSFACIGFRYFRLPDRVLEVTEELSRHIRSTRAEAWTPVVRAFQGWAQAMMGESEGIPSILKSLSLCRRAHRMVESSYLSLLAEAYLSVGDGTRSIRVSESALRVSARAGTKFYDAELWRLKGEAALLEGNPEVARQCLLHSLSISRAQGARSLRLRTSTSLGRLLVDQGRKEEALLAIASSGDLLFGGEADASLPDLREALSLRRSLLGRNVILHPLNKMSMLMDLPSGFLPKL